METDDQAWVGPVGGIILAQLQGESTPALLKDCHERIAALVRDTGCTNVLYHMLDLDPSPRGLIGVQQALNQEIKDIPLKRAILVPDARLAFRAAIAFGTSSRVFSDLDAAVAWLEHD
jgi:hypothetical protein